MATSLIPDKKQKRSSGQMLGSVKDVLREFISAFVLFGVVVLVYFGVALWSSFLGSEIEDIKAEKRSIVNSVSSQGDVMEFREFALFIHSLQQLLEDQNTPSEFFDLFDGSIHERVNIRTFSFSMESATIEVSGNAPSFEALGQQMLIWVTRTEFAERVELKSFGKSNEGNIDFQATIKVGEDYF